MKRKYVRPKMDIVTIKRPRLLVVSESPYQMNVLRSSGSTDEEIEDIRVGW